MSATCPACCGPATCWCSTTPGSSPPASGQARGGAVGGHPAPARGRRHLARLRQAGQAAAARRHASIFATGPVGAGRWTSGRAATSPALSIATAPTCWRPCDRPARCRCRPISTAPTAATAQRPRTTTRPCSPHATGAVAAPTAGLHFTPDLLARLDAARHRRVRGHAACRRRHLPAGARRRHRATTACTPNGARSPPATADAINAARQAGGRIVAVGTTALRLLETRGGATTARIAAVRGETDIFITPGYRFRAADLLLTNFHLPRSTLFMLVCAFAGTERMRAAYAHAIAAGYRFYSYGDCCLLERAHDGCARLRSSLARRRRGARAAR